MRNNGFHDGGYQSRRELRRAYEEWLAEMDVDLAGTDKLFGDVFGRAGIVNPIHLTRAVPFDLAPEPPDRRRAVVNRPATLSHPD
jgi:hypothetical protein